MASQLEILINMRSDVSGATLATKALQGVSQAADSADQHLQKVGTGAASFSDKIKAAGDRARQGLSAISQLSNVAGSALGQLSGEAGQVASAIGGLVTAFAMMGGIGLAVAGVSLAVSALISVMQAQEQAASAALAKVLEYEQALRAPFEATKAAIQGLVKPDPFAELAKSVGVTAEAIRGLAEASEDARDKLNRLLTSLAGAKVMEDRIARIKTELRELGELADEQMISKGIVDPEVDARIQELTNMLHVLEPALLAAKEAQVLLTGALAEGAGAFSQIAIDTDAYYDKLVKIQGATNAAFTKTVELNHAGVGTGNALDANATKWEAYNKLMGQRFPVSVGVAISKYEDWKKSLSDTSAYDAAKAAAERLNAVIKGFVENAVAVPSFEEHLKRIADGGKDAYENLFRLDAVATGTSASEYGANFEALAAQLEGMGYSASQAAAGIRDFSIFAEHPELVTSGLIDMGAVVEDVKNQLLGMAGKANVVKEAMKQVWASLDPKQKADLAAAGIDDASEAVNALLDPAGQATTQVQGLNSALGAIPRAVTTVIGVVKDAATLAIEEFRTVLDKFIADYGSISISINAEATAGNTNNGTTNNGTTGDTSGTGTGGAGGDFAGGLSWTVPGGFPNDSYPFRGNLTSGEHVRITPAGQSGGNTSPTIIIYVDGERVRGAKVRMLEAHGQFA